MAATKAKTTPKRKPAAKAKPKAAASKAPAKPKSEPKPAAPPEPTPEEAPVAADPVVGAEGPTGLDDQPDTPPPAPEDKHVREPKKGELVVTDPILHKGRLYPVGAAAPDDLTDDQVARFKRLGCLE